MWIDVGTVAERSAAHFFFIKIEFDTEETRSSSNVSYGSDGERLESQLEWVQVHKRRLFLNRD